MTVTRGVVQPQTNPVPLRICLGGEDSGGRLAVVEMALDPASGPPLHLHPTPTVKASMSWQADSPCSSARRS